MPPLTGYSSTLPTDVILDAGVLFLNGSTAYGALKNVTVNLGQQWRNLADDIDGTYYPIATLDVRTGGVPFIEGELQQLGDTQILDLEPGGTSVTVAPTTTVTPQGAGDLLAVGDYKTNVRVAFRRGGGGYTWVKFPLALVRGESIQGGAKGAAGSAKIRIEARQAANATDTGVAPYVIENSTTL